MAVIAASPEIRSILGCPSEDRTLTLVNVLSSSETPALIAICLCSPLLVR